MTDHAHRGAVPPDPTRQAAQRLLAAMKPHPPLGSSWSWADVRLVAEAVMEARSAETAETCAKVDGSSRASAAPSDTLGAAGPLLGAAGEVAKPVVYLAGPYSSPDPIENMHRAIKIADGLMDVCVPMIPHLTGTWHMVSPKPYPVWLDLDIALMERCDVVYRFDGASAGADGEVAHAQQIGLPVVFSEDDLRSLIPGLARREAALQAEVVRLREALEGLALAEFDSPWIADRVRAALKEDA